MRPSGSRGTVIPARPHTILSMAFAYRSIDELGTGVFRKVRQELGVTAFGVNAMVLPAADRLVRALPRRAGRALLRPPGPGGLRGRRTSASSSAPEACATWSRRSPRRVWNAGDESLVLLVDRRQGRLRRARRPHGRPRRRGAAPRVQRRRGGRHPAPSRVTIVYLARHGESDWNAANRFQGHSDRPLTALGRRQAERARGRGGRVGGPHRRLHEPVAARARHGCRGRRAHRPGARSGRRPP